MGLLHAFESREDTHQLNLLLLQNFNVVKKKMSVLIKFTVWHDPLKPKLFNHKLFKPLGDRILYSFSSFRQWKIIWLFFWGYIAASFVKYIMKTSINMQLLITVVHHKIYNQSKKILITTCRKVNISVGGKSVHAEEGIHVRINKVNKNIFKNISFPKWPCWDLLHHSHANKYIFCIHLPSGKQQILLLLHVFCFTTKLQNSRSIQK